MKIEILELGELLSCGVVLTVTIGDASFAFSSGIYNMFYYLYHNGNSNIVTF